MRAVRVPRLRGRLRRVRREEVRMGRVGVFVPYGRCQLDSKRRSGVEDEAYELECCG